MCISATSNGDDGREVLHDINLDVTPGRSGRHRRLQRRAARPRWCICCRASSTSPRGRLLIDGHDVRDLTVASLRSQIAIVTQDTILFNDTVRNNIAYGQPEISRAARWKKLPAPRWRTTSSWRCPKDTIPSSANVACG